jgi:hypothetical protein
MIQLSALYKNTGMIKLQNRENSKNVQPTILAVVIRMVSRKDSTIADSAFAYLQNRQQYGIANFYAFFYDCGFRFTLTSIHRICTGTDVWLQQGLRV